MQMKSKPIYAQCRQCFKKYDMITYGVSCPTCKDKTDKDKRRKEN